MTDEFAERVRSYFPRVSPQAALLAIPGVVALDVEVGTVRLYAEEDADPLEVREAARRIVNSACTWIAVERPPAQRAVRRIREARELAVARGSLLAALQRQVHRRAEVEGILALLPGQVHRCPPHVGEPCKFCGYFPLRAADAPGPTWLFDPSGGRGREPETWPVLPWRRGLFGFAGGIGPDNAAQVVSAVLASSPESPARFWIDMETKIRERYDAHPGGPRSTERDQDLGTYFSLARCRAVMDACTPFLG